MDIEELFSEQTVTTFGFIKPKDDILTQLRQWIDNDIETLYEIVANKKAYNMYDYKCATNRDSLWSSSTIRYLKRLIIGSKILKDGTFPYTCNKLVQSWTNESQNSWYELIRNR